MVDLTVGTAGRPRGRPQARAALGVLRALKTANRAGDVGMAVLACYVVVAIFGPWIAPHNPNTAGLATPFQRPSLSWPLGADALGRDELSRVIAGARIAVLVPCEIVGIAMALGLIIGHVGGLRSGSWSDYAASRLTDFLFSFPEYVLAIVVLAAMGTGILDAAVAIGIVFAPRFARIVRTATIEVMASPYIDSARLCGATLPQIVVRHVMKNISGPLIVMVAISMSNAEGAYAALSYLGFGAAPPTSDYGSMLSSAQPYLTSDPWLALFPALALVLIIVAFNLVGDAIRDKLSPTETQFGTQA
jgi:peptide/nickel transport system permease protein